jgi:hypothetical protein
MRNGLVTNLRTKFASVDFQISGYILSAPTPPCFDLEITAIEYDAAFVRGLDVWTWLVRGLTPKTSDIGSQVVLDGWLAPSGALSVKEALESDMSLGGAAETLHVTNLAGPRLVGVPAPSGPPNVYHGCEWTVVIHAQGISS